MGIGAYTVRAAERLQGVGLAAPVFWDANAPDTCTALGAMGSDARAARRGGIQTVTNRQRAIPAMLRRHLKIWVPQSRGPLFI